MTFKATGQRPFPLPHAAEGAGLADCSGLNAQAKGLTTASKPPGF